MKLCPACKLSFEPQFFYKNSHQKDGLSIRCKSCYRDYERSSDRLVKRAWINMNSRVMRQASYKNIKVLITRDEFLSWATPIFKNWDYSDSSAPSIDRIDGFGNYELGNMQVIPLSENRKKHRTDKIHSSPVGKSWCHRCKDYLSLSNFWACKSNSNGLQKRCKSCQQEAKKISDMAVRP